MKIRILDRILVALAGLLMVAGGAALAAQLFFGKDVAARVTQWLNDDSLRVFVIITGILVFLIGIYCVLLLFRHRGKKGKFIMQRTEGGELAISLKALETMVQKCLDQHKELTAQAVNLENQKGSLVVRIRGTVAGGISIPLTVDTLQQQIKQYVTACSGVEVKDIRVEIESSGPDAKDAPFAIEAPAARGLLKSAEEVQAQAEKETDSQTVPETGKLEGAEGAAASAAETAAQAKDELSAAAAAAAQLMDQAPEEDDDRPIHQRLFSTVGEPCVMPMPPMNLEEEKPEESGEKAADPETAKEAGEKAEVPEEKAEETNSELKESEAQAPQTDGGKGAAEEETEKGGPED